MYLASTCTFRIFTLPCTNSYFSSLYVTKDHVFGVLTSSKARSYVFVSLYLTHDYTFRGLTSHEIRAVIIDVHETVGTSVVASASVAVTGQLLPRRLRHGDVIVLQPLPVASVVDVGPVVTGRRLTLVHEHGMQSIGRLQQRQ